MARMESPGTDVEATEPSARRRGRPGRRRLVAAGVGGLALALGGAAWVSFARGSEWKERAADRGARVSALEGELRMAEADVQTLEGRVDELAEEVASAQDQRSVAELTADQAQELAALAGAIAEDLAACVEGTTELVGIVRDLEAYDPAAASGYAERVDETCGRALAGNDLLQDALG